MLRGRGRGRMAARGEHSRLRGAGHARVRRRGVAASTRRRSRRAAGWRRARRATCPASAPARAATRCAWCSAAATACSIRARGATTARPTRPMVRAYRPARGRPAATAPSRATRRATTASSATATIGPACRPAWRPAAATAGCGPASRPATPAPATTTPARAPAPARNRELRRRPGVGRRRGLRRRQPGVSGDGCRADCARSRSAATPSSTRRGVRRRQRQPGRRLRRVRGHHVGREALLRGAVPGPPRSGWQLSRSASRSTPTATSTSRTPTATGPAGRGRQRRDHHRRRHRGRPASAATAAPPPAPSSCQPVLAWRSTGSATCSSPTASNHRIRRVDAGSGVITTIAGTGAAGFGGDGGIGHQRRAQTPAWRGGRRPRQRCSSPTAGQPPHPPGRRRQRHHHDHRRHRRGGGRRRRRRRDERAAERAPRAWRWTATAPGDRRLGQPSRPAHRRRDGDLPRSPGRPRRPDGAWRRRRPALAALLVSPDATSASTPTGGSTSPTAFNLPRPPRRSRHGLIDTVAG
jgi:hypothetical protein